MQTDSTLTVGGQLAPDDTAEDFRAVTTEDSYVMNLGDEKPNVIDEATITYNNGKVPSYYTVTRVHDKLTVIQSTKVILKWSSEALSAVYNGSKLDLSKQLLELANVREGTTFQYATQYMGPYSDAVPSSCRTVTDSYATHTV